LNPEQMGLLRAIVIDRLGRAEIALPKAAEREPAFTARVLSPIIRNAISSIGVAGLRWGGDGARHTLPTVTTMGLSFAPDLAIQFERRRILAFEVKFLRREQRQTALATALGQALLYKSFGYESVGIILIETSPRRSSTLAMEFADLRTRLSADGIAAILYARAGVGVARALP
jgi:hypothetical protein